MLTDTLAIVDIETTTASALYGRIIEIAILRLQAGRIVATFESLVNPERFIRPSVQLLTGIGNEDIADSPLFEDIADDLAKLLEDAVFVAHNARFDYGFLKNEFKRVGIQFSAKCLCTVKLSRKLFPHHRRHDLNSIIARHGLICSHRHRALGDARAVYDFLKHLYQTGEQEELDAVVAGLLKCSSLPAHVDRDIIDVLPETSGVYLFHGKEGELLYVGKSVNVKNRVLSHFSSDHRSGKEMEMCQQVHAVEARRTAGELGALLLESELIKELHPIYNQAARRKRNMVVATRTITPEGYATVDISEVERLDADEASGIMAIFKSTKQAKEYLRQIAKVHRLCHKVLGLERSKGCCFPYHLKQCHGACRGEEDPYLYNRRFEGAFVDRRIKAWPYPGPIMIKEEADDNGEVFVVDQWCLLASFRYSDFGLDPHVRGSYRFDYDSYKILLRYMVDPSHRRNIRNLAQHEFLSLISDGPSAYAAGA